MGQNNPKTLLKKIDIYMRYHIKPNFDVNSIRWWFSLSGGKDSFSMATAIKTWYDSNGKHLDAKGFHINQWSKSSFNNLSISQQLPWLNIIFIDGTRLTRNRTAYKNGDQAPCRVCADIRRELNDDLILSLNKNTTQTNFIARGLHLTDTAISLLWRRVMGYNPVAHLRDNGKAQPLKRLWEGTYLVKPLYYAREFETQNFANYYSYQPSGCDCPGNNFPSRRDIVEETIAPIFKDPLWEFSIPDIPLLLNSINNGPLPIEIIKCSLKGKEEKELRLPKDFPDFSTRYYYNKIHEIGENWLMPQLDKDMSLDKLGFSNLHGESPLYEGSKVPSPLLIKNGGHIDSSLMLLITSLGPFWGALCLSKELRERALILHEKTFKIKIDEKFSHTNELLKIYYNTKNSKNEKIY